MIKHPHTRAERLKIKYIKDTFGDKSRDRASRKLRREAIKAKELEDELRVEVLGSEAQATIPAD
jgi:hypothetical protein